MHLSAADWEYISERASGFSGRTWVFERLQRHLSGPPRCLVISGPPGTGKTTISAVIAQRAAARSPTGGPATTSRFPVHAAYFCRDGRVDLLDCAQQLANQLTAALPPFATAAQSALAAQIKTGDVVVQVEGSVAAGGSVAGVRIVLDQLGAERAFSQGVALPLRRLREQFKGQVLILVDGLDETIARPEARSLPELLSKLELIHLIVTTRRDRRVLQYFEDHADRLDLLDDAPSEVDDVVEYAYGRLGLVRDTAARSRLAARIAFAADGNFLYAQHVTSAIAAGPRSAEMDRGAAETLELPEGRLPGVYRAFIRREMGRDETLWSTRLAPVLGPIAVSFGEGLTSMALAAIASEYSHSSFSQQYVRDVARLCYQFLEGPRPDGPFRVYHKSFADFLVQPSDNPDYGLEPGEIHRAIVAALGARPRSAWGWPSYEWQHLFRHAHAAGTTSDTFKELFSLADSRFLEDSLGATGEPHAVATGFELLFDVCSTTDDLSRCALYALRRQNALRLQREITLTPGLMILRLRGLAPGERADAAERMSSAAILIPEKLQRAEALLSFYRHASRDLAGARVLEQLPRSVVDLVHGLPLSGAKSRLHDELIATVVVCQPDRVSWLENSDLEPSIEAIACVDLAEGYLRHGERTAALRLLRRAILVAEDQGPFVTLEPQRLLAITSELADHTSVENLMEAATSKNGRQTTTRRALLIRIGLLAQLGREAEAAALLDAHLASVATRVHDANEDAMWKIALAVASTSEVLPYFRDDTIRERLEVEIFAIARLLCASGRNRVATALARVHALRVQTQSSDPSAAVRSVAKLLPIELGRTDATSVVIGLIQRCASAGNGRALLELLEDLAGTTEYNDRAVCVAAAIVSLVQCGASTGARAWYDREAALADTTGVKPEVLAAFAAAADSLGESGTAESLIQRAFARLSQIRDRVDAQWSLEEVLKASDLIQNSMLRATCYHELIRVATTSTTRTSIVSDVCLRACERSSTVEQRRLADAAERALAQPRESALAVAAMGASIRAFAEAGMGQDAAEALKIAFGWFRAVKDDADKPSMCDSLLHIGHPALDQEIAQFLIPEVTLAPDAYYGARALATMLLRADGNIGGKLNEAAHILIERIDHEVEGLNRVDALGLLAVAGSAAWCARNLPLLERIDALIAAGRPSSSPSSVPSSGWVSARANCSLAYVTCANRDRGLRVLDDTLKDELMEEWVEQAGWNDRPLELARAVLTIDANDASLPTLMRLARQVQRRQCAASATARAVVQALIGGADVSWEDPRALRLQPPARLRALYTAERLISIAKRQGFSGLDEGVTRFSVLSAQAMLAKAHAEGGDSDRADRMVAEAVESLADLTEEQPWSWSVSALIRHCPDGLAQRRPLEARVRDAINVVGDLSNRSGLAKAYLGSTPFERIGRLSEWLGHLASQRSTNDFAEIATALLQRDPLPHPAQHDLLRAAAIREPEDLLLVTAGVARGATGERRREAMEHLRELVGLSGTQAYQRLSN